MSEASNLLIQRVLARRKRIPENMVFLTLDPEAKITVSTYVSAAHFLVALEVGEVFE